MLRRAAVVLACCLSPLFLQSIAGAEPSAADKETARGLMVRGNELYEKGDYPGALKAYQGAHSIIGVPSTGVALARAYAALGRLIEARDMALEVTRMPPKPNEPEALKKARTQAEELATSLASKIPSLQLDIQGAPPNTQVEIRIDGVVLPANLVGLPRKVDPGRHEVTATAPGFAVSRATVEAKEGEQKVVTLVLAAGGPSVGPSAAPPTTASVAPPSVPTGTPQENKPRGGPSTLTWIGFGVGAAGLLGGTVTGVLTLGKASDAKEYCSGNACTAEAQDSIDSGKSLGMISNICFGVGAVGVAVGVITLLAAPKEAPAPTPAASKTIRIVPSLGVGSVGLNGTF